MNPISEKRKALNLTQQQLSIKSDIPISTIQKLESGARSIKKAEYETIRKIASALHCNMEELND